MIPIEMKHIGKIEAVGTVQVFGYSSRRIDEHVSDMIYLTFAGPANAAGSVWANLIERRALDFTDLVGRPHRLCHGGYPGLDGNEAPFKRSVTSSSQPTFVGIGVATPGARSGTGPRKQLRKWWDILPGKRTNAGC